MAGREVRGGAVWCCCWPVGAGACALRRLRSKKTSPEGCASGTTTPRSGTARARGRGSSCRARWARWGWERGPSARRRSLLGRISTARETGSWISRREPRVVRPSRLHLTLLCICAVVLSPHARPWADSGALRVVCRACLSTLPQTLAGSCLFMQSLGGDCRGHGVLLPGLGYRVDGADGTRLWAATHEVRAGPR